MSGLYWCRQPPGPAVLQEAGFQLHVKACLEVDAYCTETTSMCAAGACVGFMPMLVSQCMQMRAQSLQSTNSSSSSGKLAHVSGFHSTKPEHAALPRTSVHRRQNQAIATPTSAMPLPIQSPVTTPYLAVTNCACDTMAVH